MGIPLRFIPAGDCYVIWLIDGSPGFDIVGNESKIIEIKCPKCGTINLISIKMLEEVIVRLKE